MTVIKTVEPDEATGFVARSYAEDVEKLGYVASHIRAMSLNDAAAQAFVALARSTSSGLGARLYQR